MNTFYSYPDSGMVQFAPQPLQHQAIHSMAARLNGSVLFYYMEEYRTLKSQKLLMAKLPMMASANGIIFFSIQQFCYAGGLNSQRIVQILDLGLEVHFAKELISLPNRAALRHALDFLLLMEHTVRTEKTGLRRLFGRDNPLGRYAHNKDTGSIIGLEA